MSFLSIVAGRCHDLTVTAENICCCKVHTMQSYKSCIFRDILKCEFCRDITFCSILSPEGSFAATKSTFHQQNVFSVAAELSPFIIFIFTFLQYFFVPCGKFGTPYPGMAKQLQEQCYPFLSVCVIFLCVQTIVWLAGGAIKVMLTQSDKMNIC